MSSSQIVSATALHHKTFKPSASSAAAAAGGGGGKITRAAAVDVLRHASYNHNHNGFTVGGTVYQRLPAHDHLLGSHT